MRTTHKRSVLFALLALFSFGALTPSYGVLDKTRFAADLGMAFFAFHHWVYKPYKSGAFQAGTPHRDKAMIKAGLALLFAVNRIKKANEIAHTSKSPTLHRLVGPVDAMASAFSDVGTKLRSRHYDEGDITSLRGRLDDVQQGATAAGAPIKDQPMMIPGL